MNRRRNVLISLLAAVLSGVLVYSIYVLQLKQIELQETVQIIVPSRFVATGEQLTADMLTTKWIAKASYEQEMILSAAEVVSLETAVPLGEGEPILSWKVSPYRLLPKRDESTFQIPRDYVLSVSNGIRAGDRVVLYISGEETASSRLFDQLVTVASVKTSGNLEVDDPKNPNILSLANGDREKMYASRRDANAMIDYVNLNLTEEQWLRIDQLCKQGGHKLVIAYSPMSLDSVRPQQTGGQP
ncbi:flagellar biosynthesis protein FlgA [Paenibacillus sp. 1P07SE]|uniref:flagellar biosynthesis protein FlgA n=1 Tax=Paenibacillus sp. 1P07SE TaxID=3132209 RepID=UPI0039A42258